MTQLQLLIAVLNSNPVRLKLAALGEFSSNAIRAAVQQEFPNEFARLGRVWQVVLSNAVRSPDCCIKRLRGTHTYMVTEAIRASGDGVSDIEDSESGSLIVGPVARRASRTIDADFNAPSGPSRDWRAALNEDERVFWAGVEDLLEPPTTRSGCRPNRPQAYRLATFAPGLKLGIVANKSGDMRVHLWSDDATIREGFSKLEAAIASRQVRPADDGQYPELREAPRGNQLYLEFDWSREGSFSAELCRIGAYVRWFISLRDGALDEPSSTPAQSQPSDPKRVDVATREDFVEALQHMTRIPRGRAGEFTESILAMTLAAICEGKIVILPGLGRLAQRIGTKTGRLRAFLVPRSGLIQALNPSPPAPPVEPPSDPIALREPAPLPELRRRPASLEKPPDAAALAEPFNLSEALMKRHGLSDKQASWLVKALGSWIARTLLSGKVVEFEGFGCFLTRRFDAWVSVDPVSGAETPRKAMTGVVFRASREFLARLELAEPPSP